VNPELNFEAFWSLTYGLCVVTSHLDGKLNGQIVNTVIQVTAEPPRIVVSISKNNFTHDFIAKSGVFAVSVLDESTPMTFIGLFGFKSGRDTDKLSQTSYRLGFTGCPLVVENALSLFEVKVIAQVDAETHTLFLADVVRAEILRQGNPLTYAYYQQVKKGKTPKNAPTYREPTSSDEVKKPEKAITRYRCMICGFLYDPAIGDPENGIPPGTPFEELPDDWVCPVCGAPKKEFFLES
jgi:flavin reductase (DIM6/NTAB) family NADH-FMN oxidoreductase RutF/rubredoxin